MAKRGRKKKDQVLEQTLNNQDQFDIISDPNFDEYTEAYYFELTPADLRDDSDKKQTKTKGRKKSKK